MTGTEPGASQQVAILADGNGRWLGGIRLRRRAPADLARGAVQLVDECGQRGGSRARRQLQVARIMGGELELQAVRRDHLLPAREFGAIRLGGASPAALQVIEDLGAFATRRQIAARGRSHHPRPPGHCRRACSRTRRGRGKHRGLQ